MKCLTKINELAKIKVGDILVYSDCKAYLIMKTDVEYLAIQIFNNGNEELGFIDYYDSSLEGLIERVVGDNGDIKRIIDMKNVSIEF